MDITWVIEQMWAKPQEGNQTNVVVTAAWRCTGFAGEYSSTVYGSAGFTLTEGGNFTPYDQLTQDDVLGWCWASGVDKDATEANIKQQIEDQINPPIINPTLPWGI
jgi:hypothetical protein